VLYAPTVVLNSSLWGQADSLYTAALVACLYFLLKKREPLAFALLGVAFAFKLQALFLTPLLILLCLRGMVSWKNFLLVPIVYLVTILPTWLAGRRLIDLLTIYVAQGTTYRQLSEHAPNMYTWFPNDYYDLLFPAGIVWAGIVVFLFIVVAFKSPATITSPLVVEIATLSALIVPYCLPKMHERYFFPADVLSIIFAFFFPRYALVAVAIGMTSFFAYLPFLFEHEVIPLPLLALALLSVISVMAQHLIRLLWSTGSQRSYDGVS